jgi:hypothetical protein
MIRAFEQACLESGFRDFMPATMLGHFVRQIIPSSVRDNVLDTDQFYRWVRQEYSIPDHIFSRAFSRAKDSLSEMGYDLKPPEGFDPGMNDAVRDWFRSELKEVVYADLKDEMENDIREQLRQELRPEVHRELRRQFEQEELDSGVVEVEIDIDVDEDDEGVAEAVEAKRYPESLQEVTGDLQTDTDEIPEALSAEDLEEEDAVPLFEDEYYKGPVSYYGDESQSEAEEDYDDIFASTSEDFFSGWGASAGPARGDAKSRGMSVDDHLELIKRIRSELSASIKEELLADLTRLARIQEEKERREVLKERLSDPEYCLSRIGEFLFPGESEVFERVKHLINPLEWQPLILAREEDPLPVTDELARVKSVIREALQIKADIEQTASSVPYHESAAGREGARSLQGVLGEADKILDYSLQSISALLRDKIPRPVLTDFYEVDKEV